MFASFFPSLKKNFDRPLLFSIHKINTQKHLIIIIIMNSSTNIPNVVFVPEDRKPCTITLYDHDPLDGSLKLEDVLNRSKTSASGARWRSSLSSTMGDSSRDQLYPPLQSRRQQTKKRSESLQKKDKLLPPEARQNIAKRPPKK